ncbi:CNK3/IPCEF1 fusion protein isoform X7 [Schistocerca gregaria]|uniref:CNK3/IPCEF1 fusion protein isoform X7 n=1 Tax=Schistocerca gregaria TaxID=7010 RepID=UPI00211ED5D1|nr:CNK3/IPCEF1 fusion protein isoform X7 [Schistocerca gregaria]
MAYVNVAEWKPEQVTEWLKGLDNAVLPYIHSFLNNEVSGQQLLNLRPDDLDHLGVHKLGHQELILEAVEHLRDFHYELDRENLQLLALRLSCSANSLYKELLQNTVSLPVSTQTLADVANVISAVKPLVCWLDRSPFTGQLEYHERKVSLLRLSLKIATCAHLDRFAERPIEEIRSSCQELGKLADGIIQDIVDPLVLQPASLDLATLRKRPGDDLGFFLVPSFHGIHQIGEIKFSSPAHQCGKIEEGDEVVQVNYQTVVGWQAKKVMILFEESPTDVFLTLKKRPRHTKVYGQIYMKPYRLPSKKRAAPYSRWNDNLPSPRPELLTIPDFEMPLPRSSPKQQSREAEEQPEAGLDSDVDEDDDDDDDETFLPGSADDDGGQASPTSARLYLPKQRSSVQRRATVTGASPTSKRSPVKLEELLRGLPQEGRVLRDKSASVGHGLSSGSSRPATCLGIEGRKSGTRGILDKSHSTPAYDLTDSRSVVVRDAAIVDSGPPDITVIQAVNLPLVQANVSMDVQKSEMSEVGNSTEPSSSAAVTVEHTTANARDIIPLPPGAQSVPSSSNTERTQTLPLQNTHSSNTPSESAPPTKPRIPLPLLSPRTQKKRNLLLSRRRNIPAAEATVGAEKSGWLVRRCRQGGAGAAWVRAWCVLRAPVFYGFRSREAAHADIMVSLPGFTAAPATEVKSKSFAFKIYHTGTVFYFAVESEDELTGWLDCISAATVVSDSSQEPEVVFSETEEEDPLTPLPMDQDSNHSSPKSRRFAAWLGGSSQPGSPQNAITTSSTGEDSGKISAESRKFGSLKKVSSNKIANTAANESSPNPSSSLDRKYLRFLGAPPQPVPTARFRSYRRVVPAAPQRRPVTSQAAGSSRQCGSSSRNLSATPETAERNSSQTSQLALNISTNSSRLCFPNNREDGSNHGDRNGHSERIRLPSMRQGGSESSVGKSQPRPPLKPAAQYQPPPAAVAAASTLAPGFEMHLGEKTPEQRRRVADSSPPLSSATAAVPDPGKSYACCIDKDSGARESQMSE